MLIPSIMMYKLLILFLLLTTVLPVNAEVLSCANRTVSVATSIDNKQNPIEESAQKKRKIKKSKSDKKFPLYGIMSVSAAILTLLMLGLGIFFQYQIFMAIVAALLAISALILAIIGLKKGESKTWNFLGLMIGAVGLLGVLFFAISIGS